MSTAPKKTLGKGKVVFLANGFDLISYVAKKADLQMVRLICAAELMVAAAPCKLSLMLFSLNCKLFNPKKYQPSISNRSKENHENLKI